MLSRESSATLMSAVTAFIYKEARLQDEHQYEAWEALWTDDGVYWVPANGADIDPEKEMSIIYDNRSRISLRIKQLLTGKRHTQTPQSRLRPPGADYWVPCGQTTGGIVRAFRCASSSCSPASATRRRRSHGCAGWCRILSCSMNKRAAISRSPVTA